MGSKKKYDFLLVGAGLFNAVFAYIAGRKGKKCLIVEKRNHVGGNLYCESIENINVHMYGAHIFHTNKKQVWDFMHELCTFNHYINSPLAIYRDELYNIPFNMNTFHQLWGVKTPAQALKELEKQRIKTDTPTNFEEQALCLVGKDIYEKLIKGYTEKQWGKKAIDLPSFLIKRIPLRFTYNNNYFDSCFQGIPIGGYMPIFEKCFENCDLALNINFTHGSHLANESETVIYTGMIDEYFNYCFGELEYRSLHFENEIIEIDNYQGNAVINYTDREIPFTRIIEHKHFEFGNQAKTVITREYPKKWKKGLEAYYPINTDKNNALCEKYRNQTKIEKNIYFAGRLGTYQYNNMDETVYNAIELSNQLVK